MPKCPFCDHENPAGVDRCQSCGTWLEQKAGAISSEPEHKSEPVPEPDSLEAQLLGLMQGGKKIEAVKLYRQKKGCDLLHAKEAVEALAEKYGISPRGSGCAAVLAMMLLTGATLATGMWLLVT
jgi:ribosomal protein L7/L12